MREDAAAIGAMEGVTAAPRAAAEMSNADTAATIGNPKMIFVGTTATNGNAAVTATATKMIFVVTTATNEDTTETNGNL